GPLVLRLPVLSSDQDREFREPRRDAGAESAMRAELLGEFAEGRRVEVAIERTAHLELAARPGADRVDERTLSRREAVLRDRRKADRRRFLGGHWRPRITCTGGV